MSNRKLYGKLLVVGHCGAPWEQMTGGDAVRTCRTCCKPVHNLAAITRAEAEALVRTTNRFCRRAIVRRSDRALMLADGPLVPAPARPAGGPLLVLCGVVATILAAVNVAVPVWLVRLYRPPAVMDIPAYEPFGRPAVDELPAGEPVAGPAVDELPAGEPVAGPSVDELPAEAVSPELAVVAGSGLAAPYIVNEGE